MAGRAPEIVESDSARSALFRSLDYFPTPPWAARAGAELILCIDPLAKTVWEPACGEGHMAAALTEYFTVFASDIHSFGFGDVCDFTDETLEMHDLDGDAAEMTDWVVTNPPFKSAAEFIRLGLRRARRGVAMLVRLQFLEGVGRHELLHGAHPVAAAAVFAERVPMTLGRWDPKASTATAYVWLLWLKEPVAESRLLSIPPGTRARLSMPQDADRFGFRSSAQLLDAMEAA